MKYRRDFQQSNVFRVRRRVWRHCKILMKISNSFILVFLQSFSEYKKYRKRISLKYIYLLIALYNYKLLCCNNLLSICYLRKELLYLDELCLERGLCYHLGIFFNDSSSTQFVYFLENFLQFHRPLLIFFQSIDHSSTE